ncbi:MAG: hypothetical protein ACM3IJ_03620 [Candidatus Levyibacteriota bacterium]
MEIKIEELKDLYIKEEAPKFLQTQGVADLWERVDSYKEMPKFYLSRYMVIAALVLVVSLGGVGIASAQAKPGNLLYPVKKAVGEAVVEMAHFAPKSIRNNIINIVGPNPTATPTPTINPGTTPGLTPTPSISKVQREDSENHENQDKPESKEAHEDVRGASTQAPPIPTRLNESGNENKNTNTDNSGNNNNQKSFDGENHGQGNEHSNSSNGASTLTQTKSPQKHQSEE